MRNVLTPSAERVLVPLALPAAASATDAVNQRNIFGSRTAALIFSNKDLNNIMNIVKSLEEAGFFIKVVAETVENKAKEQMGEFLGMLAATLASSLLGSMLSGKGVLKTGERTIRVGQDF